MSASAVYTAQSGCVSITLARSFRAMTPVGFSSPASSAAPRPALASPGTHSAVSSNWGLARTPVNACRPTLPVPIWATLIAIDASLQVGDGELEVGHDEAAVHFERLAGEVGPRR